jgi:5-oxoprolinase (ATP-hydrolysing)
VLAPLSQKSLEQLEQIVHSLTMETINHVRQQGIDSAEIDDPMVELELRYSGTESTLEIPWANALQCRREFEKEYRRLFGYTRPDRPIEIAAVIVEAVGQAVAPKTPQQSAQTANGAVPDSTTTTYMDGQHLETNIYLRDLLKPGCVLDGPVIISEPTSTILVEPGCRAEILLNGSVLITIGKRGQRKELSSESTALSDPVLLEVFNNQFVSIAEQMGQTLRRTAVSTNVRERLDYSCALFDRLGRLVVNAPHIPVHLGAMSETVCAIMQDHPHMQPGDVYVTNDPYRGGSHLPDVTVITPVFVHGSVPSFFVANRAHHAEIGGSVPGSMPPFSTCLAEEGVLIRSRHLVRAGHSLEDELRAHLSEGAFPSRSVDDNLADLAAQAAANVCGASLLTQLCSAQTADQVQQYMQHVQKAAERKMRLAISRLENRDWNFVDYLDDGSAIQVRIAVDDDSASVDFTGSSEVHPGNLNANRAITTAAVLYAFRCLLNEDVPLNDGVLRPLNVIIPSGLLNPPAGEDPSDSPAMVGGNVETSQRIVDVLLGALRLAAASQGTMNNLTFGDGTFGYYETICGGAGATPTARGADAVHTHMTNTRLTDPEILEQRYPVRLQQFSIRGGSGGDGRFRGGDGIIREIEFLKDLQVSMLSERRKIAPWGLDGGDPGLTGRNSVLADRAQLEIDLPGAFSRQFHVGDTLRVETPGGGGCGPAFRSS